MKTISITNDIVPIAEFKTGISKWFKSLKATGHPLIITQNGKPAGVLLSPGDYDELVYKKSFLDSIGRGIADADSGKTYHAEDVRAALTARRNKGYLLMNIRWAHEALERLIEIEDYISKDSPGRAVQFVEQLIEHSALLSGKPRMGRAVPELANPDIRELLFNKYRIVYRLKANRIEILTVFDGHRLLRVDACDVE